MANEMKFLKGFKAKSGDTTVECGLLATAISGLTSGAGEGAIGVGINAKNNLEISNRPDSTISSKVSAATVGDKVNIVSYGSIQIKPGLKEATKAGEIAFDNEFNTVDPYELKMHICNGAKDAAGNDKYSNDTMALKLNVAEITLDTKKANKDIEEGSTKTKFDPTEMKVRLCTDKWNKGVSSSSAGPIYAKWEARAHDIRCYDHGGIALQIAGRDSDSHENKIKFESDRTSGIGEAPVYCKEGGKGVEFGTFNTEHASLYTGDYRFKGDAKVYGVTRGAIETSSTGKKDYPKQSDDFADIVNTGNGATWNEIIAVAKAYAANEIGGVSENVATKDYVAAEIARAALSADSVDMSVFATKDEVEEVISSALTEYAVDMTGYATEEGVANAISESEAKTELVREHIFRKAKNGNFEIDVTGLYKYATENDAESESAEAGEASLDLTAVDKIALKSSAADSTIAFNAQNLVAEMKLTKGGKIEDYTGVQTDKCKTADAVKTAIAAKSPFVGIAVENAFTGETVGIKDVDFSIKVSLYDLLSLVGKVADLTTRVEALEAALAANHPTVSTPEEPSEEPQA